jgi:arylsulfatase
MISLNDHYIGEMITALDRAGLTDSTVVVFNADHGEMLGDHGLLFKGAYFYEGLVHVPLIIRAPGKFPSGVKVDSLVQEIDVLPTLLELIGVPAPEGIQGQSLVATVKGSGPRQDAVYSEFPTIKMIRTERWKLVHYVGQKYGELYDLKQDPNELTNVFGDSRFAEAQEEMERRLTDWLIKSVDPLLKPLTAQN